MTDELQIAVLSLPEVYQPIWGRTDLSAGRSRGSEDRLQHLLAANSKIKTLLGRPLKVLDLGCAQGYFSHALSDAGAQVHGVDYLAENIAVCEAIARERGDETIRFTCGGIEHVIESLLKDEYDLVIGLSVFHHLIQAKGLAYVKSCIQILSQRCGCCIFEFATADEPVHWAECQPKNVEDLLVDFPFVFLLAEHATHLSRRTRPLYFASRRIFYTGEDALEFDRWTTVSNALVPDARQGKRRFFFTKDKIMKLYRLTPRETSDLEVDEWRNEAAFLNEDIGFHPRPMLHASGRTDREAWLIRESYEGTTLDKIIQNDAPYDPVRVFNEILAYLHALEQIGLFHNDVRVWNTLIKQNGSAILIDYGAISQKREDCSWPGNLMLSFLIFAKEVFSRKIEFPVPNRSSWMNPDQLPHPFGQAFWKVLSRPIAEWNFSNLTAALKTLDADAQGGGEEAIPASTASFFMQRYEEAADDLRRHLSWLEEQSRVAARQAADEAQQKAQMIAYLEHEHTELEGRFKNLLVATAERDAQISRLQEELSVRGDEITSILTSKRWKLIGRIASTARFFSWK